MSLTQAERITRLETQLENVEEKLDSMIKKLDQVHEVFLQAKGAKWMLIAGAALTGFLATYIPSIVSYLSGLPR